MSSLIANGTAIVALRTATDVIVGADGKIHYDGARDDETTCKIFQVGRVFFTFAGIASDTHGFDVADIATDAIQQGGTMVEMMVRFQHSVALPLYNVAASIWQSSPDRYQRLTGNAEALSMAFFGIENNVPALVYRYFEPTFPPNKEGMRLEGKLLEINDYLLWGHNQPLVEFLNARPSYWSQVGDVNAIRNLIQLAIDDMPAKVGKPIAILRVSRKGAQWVHKSSCCPPIQRY